MRFDLTKPCKTCPFRKDRPFILNEHRVREIISGLYRDRSFACHSTTTATGRSSSHPKAQHCAGALLFLERRHFAHQLMRIAERIGIYNPQKLLDDSKDIRVYQTIKGMVKGCSVEATIKHQEKKKRARKGSDS